MLGNQMMEKTKKDVLYANVIVDISIDKLDKTFQYLVPEELQADICEGVQVRIPFGNRLITGFVMELTHEAEFDVEKIRPIHDIVRESVAVEAELIALAGWMKRHYGSTMNQAIKTVLPVKKKSAPVEHKSLVLTMEPVKARAKLALFESRHNTAKARLLRELLEQQTLDYSLVTQKLGVSATTIRSLKEQGILSVETTIRYRTPTPSTGTQGYDLQLNPAQQGVVDTVCKDMDAGCPGNYLLMGVTGSGKTEVYMELIAHVIAMGKQAIVLIPEIALTYQTLMRFYKRFGDRVSILNSRMSSGERYDQFERAKKGEIDIMIGPRSALFTPFEKLGLIIVDEEHESSYKSETAPRYQAGEVAIKRAKYHRASVILGSATPSVDSFYRVRQGSYKLLTLSERIDNKPLPECEIIDMRQELKEGNKSILSMRLQELMEERLEKKQQMMLFLNRRGLYGFVSCRSCGHVIKCPHCDVSLSLHTQKDRRMVCHYCGYEITEPQSCPSCQSKYLGAFKAGTEKIEQVVQKRFPAARILRMDSDTTKTKDSYETILQAFANQEADILLGTQMIVKGHDFPNVTLVGVLAADMSLHVSDYHAAERTFQLLTQAIGRSGRGRYPGQAVIQTYNPDNFAILAAQKQDFGAFYEQEIAYRSLMSYPPVFNLLLVYLTSKKKERLDALSERLAFYIGETVKEQGLPVMVVGPADATVTKIKDEFRKVIYMKAKSYDILVGCKDAIEVWNKNNKTADCMIQFDFNPGSGF